MRRPNLLRLAKLVACAGIVGSMGGCPTLPFGDGQVDPFNILSGEDLDPFCTEPGACGTPVFDRFGDGDDQWVDPYEVFLESLVDLPSVTVRIVNNTASAAQVDIESSVAEPETIGEDEFYPMDPWMDEMGPYYFPLDSQVVTLAAGGTATGSVKCGDVIAISALVPTDADGNMFYPIFPSGIYVAPGNVQFSGTGSLIDSGSFTGDTLSSGWMVRPADDGLDCEGGVLVITIDTSSTRSVYDDETGALVVGAALGAGTVAVEAAQTAE